MAQAEIRVEDEPVHKQSRRLRFLLTLHAFVGHTFASQLLRTKSRPLKFLFFCVACLISNVAMLTYAAFVVVHIVKSIRDFASDRRVSSFAFTLSGSFGISLGLVRVICMTVRSSQICKLFEFPLRVDFVDRFIVSRAAKLTIWITAVNLVVYVFFMVVGAASALSMKSIVFNGSSTYIFNATNDKTWQYMERSERYKDMMENMTPASFTFYVLLTYGIGILLVCKYVLASTFDFFCYFVVVALFQKMSSTLSGSINSGDATRIREWLRHHCQCVRINKTTSASVTATVVFNTAQACVINYVAAMGIFEIHHSLALFVFSVTSLQYIFIYCYFGHRIKALTAAMHAAAYESQWIGGAEVSRKAAVMIATVTCNTEMLHQVGGPFFSLSMESFVSILGATTTYFLILLQFK